jgi:hypothetical protein
VTDIRVESDCLGLVEVPADKLWGAQARRTLEHFRLVSPLPAATWAERFLGAGNPPPLGGYWRPRRGSNLNTLSTKPSGVTNARKRKAGEAATGAECRLL